MIKINDIKLNSFAIYCHNENEYTELMKLLNKDGFVWSDGNKTIEKGIVSVRMLLYPVYIFIFKKIDTKDSFIAYGSVEGFNDYYKEHDDVNGNTIFDSNDFLS